MSSLIAITGPSGVGKTTLLQALAEVGGFALGDEEHSTRPFQSLFKEDPRFALPNQLDYLLRRAEQERDLRAGSLPGLMDGGLDQDFFGFTWLFHDRGLLSDADFDLCRRFHAFVRGWLPPPELVVALRADPQAIRERLAGRERINIASAADAEKLEAFLEEWLQSRHPSTILRLDVTAEGPDYSTACRAILDKISEGKIAMRRDIQTS